MKTKVINPILVLRAEPDAFGATQHTAIQWQDVKGNYHLGWIPTELLATLRVTHDLPVERAYDDPSDWRPRTGENAFGHCCPRGSAADIAILRLPNRT